jgi:hypothetical protein
MKAQLRSVDDHGVVYSALMFVCPGCAANVQTLPDGTPHSTTGLHMLSVNSPHKSPSWEWDGNTEAPTLAPSILTRIAPYDEQGQPLGVCHSFLRSGVFEYLGDCTHPLAGQHVAMVDLPGWAVKEA